MKKTARAVFQRFPYYETFAPEVLTCHDEFLHVNHDGTVTLFDADRREVMVLKGGVCDNNSGGGSSKANANASSDATSTSYSYSYSISTNSNSNSISTDCVNGLVMKGSDKTLRMGGRVIRQALVTKSDRDKPLSPWPFEEEPANKFHQRWINSN